MTFDYFSYNGDLLPAGQAVIPLDNIEYSYGFGVYETIRVAGGKPYFLDLHSDRLLSSAKVIGLEHSFTSAFVAKCVEELVTKNSADSCNVKVLLIGAASRGGAKLYIQCLSPLYPDRKLYAEGAHFITLAYQRDFPTAKTLNMLPSYLAYRQAKQAGAYDALLTNSKGQITEGTRTNFLAVKGDTIFSTPQEQILPGIMRRVVLEFAQKSGFTLAYQPISEDDLSRYDAAFVTSTSAKILPVKSTNNHVFGPRPPSLDNLITQFGAYLEVQRKTQANS